MKYKYFKQSFFFLFLISFSVISQNQQEKQRIIQGYDLSKLKGLQEKFSEKFKLEKNRAILLAAQRGWRLKYTDSKGSYYELMKISEEGKPLYYKTENIDAAISTRTNFLHKDGGLGLNIEGQGMTAYVWDGGLARGTHQEYDGDGGEDRFSIGDGTTNLRFHAAHVMGTIISSGFEPAAKGMAPKAKGIGNDWSADLSEATAAAANGMLVSNHSYGFDADDIADWRFGAYAEDARDWDNLMYNAPYYLQINSAGNDGNNNTANGDPLDGDSSFDKINGRKTSKNALTIANGQDATINADGTLASVNRNTGSSEGPTDDLRIKPDLMGNGTGVYSTYQQADDAYNTISGTSMAAPNVTGSLLLLQQYYNESYGNFMRAATLKGLALHTADDTDIAGPDSHTGWGLMNTKVAAETITKNGFESWISEEVLSNGSSYTINVKSDGFSPLLASISWTDKPGVANEGTLNDATPALVNDLDIRITQGANEYKPWRLTGVYSNEKEDNLVDPFERVDVASPSGEYTITVTHKGTLAEDQRFSLIVTGISAEFTFLADSSEKEVCSDSDAVFNFEYRQAVAGTTQFTATGVPQGMTMSFSETSLSADGNFNITFGNLANVPAGPYDIEVSGDNGNETQKRKVRLVVYHQNFDNYASEIESPINGQKGISYTNAILKWKKNLNAQEYTVEVSDSPSFANILFTNTAKDTEFEISGLDSNKVYYWKIKPKNQCAEGSFSAIYSFQTGSEDCTNTYTASDFTNASGTPFTSNITFFVPIEITEDLLINNIKVNVDITHSDIKDLTLVLKEPTENGPKQVTLLSKVCDDTDNISNVTFDDNANDLVCSTDAPAVSGMVKPEESLSGFGGRSSKGTWLFEVNDFDLFDGGQINSASITICSSLENTNVPTFSSTSLVLDGNSNYVITTANMNASTASETDEQQVYTLVELTQKGALEKDGTTLNTGDTFTQADIASGKIVFTNSEVNSFNDQFKVDIINGADGWLPNQIITIEETTLNIEQFSINEVSLWPNPTKGVLNVKLNNVSGEKVMITLFDLQGRKVVTTINEPTSTIFTKEIETKTISSGIYLLSIQQGNKKVTRKIIVAK